ncbi:putative pectin lyase E [Paramyrothecium foliicola]|nr:putative pectin lyase E [Paramyrothecium foliicola]
MVNLLHLLSILAVAPSVYAQVRGKAFGFAAGTTGGGNVAPIRPNTNAELVALLTDNQPRVILIDKTFNFLNTEGKTNTRCCSLSPSSTCPGGSSKGQLWIGDTCDGGTWVSCSYDNAPSKPIDVKSNKSLVGVGSGAAIRGKGLRLRGGVSNIIIQNIHFTDLNPQYVWGGDAITLDGCDRVWLDHNKFSLIGRQMLVAGWGAAGHVTISDNEFDGRTTWSTHCNGKHYWGLLLIGKNDLYTITGNWFHDLSGRAPHLGTGDDSRNVVHVVNNYFQNIDGHALDITANAWALIEGNFFENVKEPISAGSYTSGSRVYHIQTVAEANYAQGALGYIPEWNRNGGNTPAVKTIASTEAITTLGRYKSNIQWAHWKVQDVPANNNAAESNSILFASLSSLKSADSSTQEKVYDALHMPDFLLSRPYAELNGFCGRHIEFENGNEVQELSYWCRYVIKQTGRSLRAKPSFVRHDAPTSSHTPPTLTDKHKPLHGHATLDYGWEWYEMMFNVTWAANKGSTIACFDVPEHLQLAIKTCVKQLKVNGQESKLLDPYAMMANILHHLLPAYDRSVWAIRDHVCAWEAAREATDPDYALLHEIARHAIHVSETIEVAARSCRALISQRDDFISNLGKPLPPRWAATSDLLLLTTQVLENLLSRAGANKARIQNEAGLAFHLAAQRDSKTQLFMAENMREETVAMKNLSLAAVAFLPATFVCSVFGTAFFDFDAGDDGGSFVISDKFWIFWVTVVPVVTLTLAVWFYFHVRQKRKNWQESR